MRAARRLSRYVAIAVLSLVILLGAGVAVTQTSWFKNWLRQKAVSQAAQFLNGEHANETCGHHRKSRRADQKVGKAHLQSASRARPPGPERHGQFASKRIYA